MKTHTHCKEAMVLAKTSTKCGDAEAATRTASTTPETNTRPGWSSSPRTRSECDYARVGTRTRASTHSVASPQKRSASTTRTVTPGETSTSSAKRRRGGATSALFAGDHVAKVLEMEMESGEMERMESDYDSDSTVSYSDWS